MDEITALWLKAKEYIRPQITGVSFVKWINNLEAVINQNNILVLQASDDLTKQTIEKYYFDIVRAAVIRANPSILDILLILPGQRKDFIKIATDNGKNTNTLSLNPKYTFETFVVGGSNHFANAAALAAAENPGKAYNPLFLYGGVGLGKTHLMQAIGHYVREKNPGASVLYITSEVFTNELIECLRAGKNMEFRKRYRNVDVLLIDDIQFISGKQQTQEEFFNTFNTLHNAGRQIVISSDRAPKEITGIEDRLRSRFEWGLIADIQPPDVETRIAILRNRALIENAEVSDDIIGFIAENVQSNIRQLEGSLTTVIAYSRLKGRPLNIALAREALKEIIPKVKKAELNCSFIKETVASYFGVPLSSMLSQRRDKEVVVPRQVAMYFCHTLLSLPYKRIATEFDRTDHTTAISACERICSMIEQNPEFAAKVEDIQKLILDGASL